MEIAFLFMPKKRTKKITPPKEKELKKTVSEILVANEKDLRPYIEILNFTPENIIQSQMGSLLAVFEIKSDDESSAYIVNFLSSVAKKEYFANPKKTSEESFESALNKINLALSEIAKHGNTQWLGKTDIAICAIEKNNIYFSVTGSAKIILARNGTLTDITQGLAPKGEPYPLRTFTDTAGGQLKDGDKLIITTGDIFHILSLSEIEKKAFSFSKEKFAQFLKTALINELEIAGTIVADIYENSVCEPKMAIKKKTRKEKPLKDFNAFSEKTFKEASIISPPSDKKLIEKAEQEKEPKKKEIARKEYTDKKTGHIYVRGGNERQDFQNNLISRFSWLFLAKEKIAGVFNQAKNELKNKAYGKTDEIILILKDFKNFLWSAILRVKNNFLSAAKNPAIQKIEINKNSRTKLLPDFSKIKEIFLRMDYQQKVYAFLILAVIIILPLIIIKIKNKTDSPYLANNPAIQERIFDNENLVNEKNIEFVEISSLYSHADLIGQVLTNKKLLAVTKQKIIEVRENQETKEFPLPPELGDIISFALMKDLNLLFLLTDEQKIVSFSPLSRKFKENNIQLPENSKVSAIATYLTYIYLADSENNQIYRYPRAEGGFGEKTGWLKENFDLKNISDMAIDGNIYLASGNSLLKFSRGKKEEFNPEASSIPINFNKVFTDNGMEHIYVLDSLNGRIIKFNRDGKIITQYGNESIKNAGSFFVDEKSGRAYFATANGELVYFVI